MGDGGDSSSSDYMGDSGGSILMTAEQQIKYEADSKKNLGFLMMGATSLAIVIAGINIGATLTGQHVDYTKNSIEFCVNPTYKVITQPKPTLIDRAVNSYCEPVITAYVGNESNPNSVKDSDLKFATVNKITELRTMYISPTKKNELKNKL